MNFISRWLGRGALFLLAAAILKELTRPADKRDWHGSIFSVPYDFRLPTLARLKARWWNPKDKRIFTPDVFGVGWSVNLYQLVRNVQRQVG